MGIDRKGNYKLLFYFIVNLLVFMMMKSVFFSEIDYCLFYFLIELIGYLIMIFVGIIVLIWGMRIVLFKCKRIEFLIIYISGVVWFLLIFSIVLLNKFYGIIFIKFISIDSFIFVGGVVFLVVVINIKFGGWFILLYLLVLIVLEYVFGMIDVLSVIGMYV